MEFEQQIENLKIIVDLKPKYYLTWQNKEKDTELRTKILIKK